MNRYFHGALLLVLASLLNSCSFRKLVAGKKPKVYVWNVVHNSDSAGISRTLPPLDTTGTNATDSTAYMRELITQVTPFWTNRLQYNTFYGKAKMHMEAPDDKQEFTAHIRIRKDSVIWINITALGGFTFGKVLITRDSFFMVNMIQKTAICVPLSKAAKVLPAKVDFYSLQNLILGEPLREGAIVGALNLKDTWVATVEDSSYMQEVTYNKNDSSMIAGHLFTHNPSGPHATTMYGHYETADGRRISTDRVLDLQNGNDFYKLEMNFVKVSFDILLEYPFSIPKNYTIKPVAP